MPDGTTPKGENDDKNKPENNGSTQSNTNGGEKVDWKAKYEESEKQLTEMRMWKNKASDLTTELEQAKRDKESVETKLSNLQTEQEKASKRTAAETKQSELLAKASDRTKKLVKDLGLELADAEDEEAIKAFEQKVQALESNDEGAQNSSQSTIKQTPPVNSNNNRPEGPQNGNAAPTEQQSIDQERERLKDVKF